MFSRISSLSLLLALVACGVKEDDKVATAAPDDRIACALHGAGDFTKSCAVEAGEGTMLTLRHADGGFRRIDLAPNGTLSAFDGSDAAGGKMLPDGRFELVIGGDRYRLPPRK
jgi:hypothetical protein